MLKRFQNWILCMKFILVYYLRSNLKPEYYTIFDLRSKSGDTFWVSEAEAEIPEEEAQWVIGWMWKDKVKWGAWQNENMWVCHRLYEKEKFTVKKEKKRQLWLPEIQRKKKKYDNVSGITRWHIGARYFTTGS